MNICAAAVHVVPTPVASFLPGVNLCLVLGSGDRTPTPSTQAAPVSVLCCEAPWIKAPNVRWVSPLIYKEWGLYLPTHTHTHSLPQTIPYINRRTTTDCGLYSFVPFKCALVDTGQRAAGPWLTSKETRLASHFFLQFQTIINNESRIFGGDHP